MSKKKDETSVEEFHKVIMNELNKEETLAYSLDEKNPTTVTSFISTGSTILDYKISNRRNGGIPVGKIVEVNGEESSGKSLMMSHIVANTQKAGGIAVYADSEYAVSKDFMQRVGVNVSNLSYWNPKSLEQFFTKTEQIILKSREKFPNKEKPVVIILDSIAATPTEIEIEGTYDPNGRMGLMAKAMSLGMKKLTSVVGIEHVTLVFVNQLRMKMNAPPFSDPFVTPGGKALPYHASVRIRLYSKGKVKDKDGEVLGVGCKAKIYKNRLAGSPREAEFNIMFDRGIDDAQSIFDCLKGMAALNKRTNGNTIMTTSQYGVASLEGLEFKSSEWKTFFKEHREEVFDLLDKLLIKEYTDTTNLDNETTSMDQEDLS